MGECETGGGEAALSHPESPCACQGSTDVQLAAHNY